MPPTNPTAPVKAVPPTPSPRESAGSTDEQPTVVKLHAAIVCGGQTVDVIELKPRGLWSVQVDWDRRIVWVYVLLSNGKRAKAWTPFENVKFSGFANEELPPANTQGAA